MPSLHLCFFLPVYTGDVYSCTYTYASSFLRLPSFLYIQETPMLMLMLMLLPLYRSDTFFHGRMDASFFLPIWLDTFFPGRMDASSSIYSGDMCSIPYAPSSFLYIHNDIAMCSILPSSSIYIYLYTTLHSFCLHLYFIYPLHTPLHFFNACYQYVIILSLCMHKCD